MTVLQRPTHMKVLKIRIGTYLKNFSVILFLPSLARRRAQRYKTNPEKIWGKRPSRLNLSSTGKIMKQTFFARILKLFYLTLELDECL